MAARRVILEMGAGNDLHGGDYTKAAMRAVQDALHHSSLTMIRTLKIDPKSVQVDVTIGVQRPDQVDVDALKATLPVGTVTVTACKGGVGRGRWRRRYRHRQRRHPSPVRFAVARGNLTRNRLAWFALTEF